MIGRRSNRYSIAAVAMQVAIALAIAGCSAEDRPMTTLAPKSDLAQWIQSLYIDVTVWDAIIFAIVVAAFILAVFVFSSRVGEAGPASTASSDLGLEIAWTLGPALVLLMISVPTIRTIFRSQPAVAPAGALEIKVVAHQWWWEFEYPDGAKTSNELHIPGQPPDSSVTVLRGHHTQLLGSATRRQTRRSARTNQRADIRRDGAGNVSGTVCGILWLVACEHALSDIRRYAGWFRQVGCRAACGTGGGSGERSAGVKRRKSLRGQPVHDVSHDPRRLEGLHRT